MQANSCLSFRAHDVEFSRLVHIFKNLINQYFFAQLDEDKTDSPNVCYVYLFLTPLHVILIYVLTALEVSVC